MMSDKKLRELAALIESKEVLRPYEVGAVWGLETPAISKYLNEFKRELARDDSKLPANSLVYHSRKAQWVKRKAFTYFMDNYIDLMDEVARKNVSTFVLKGGE